ELWRIMIGPQAELAVVAGQVVDPIRDRLAKRLVGEVMDLDRLRLPLRLPLRTDVLELADQLLLLGVDRYDRLTAVLVSDHLPVDVLELSIAVRMRRAFLGLAISLPTIAGPLQQAVDGAIRHGMALILKFLGQLAGALTGPAQGGLGVPSGRGINQPVQGRLQSRVDRGQPLPTTAWATNPRRAILRRLSLTALQFAEPGRDGI